MNVKSERKSTTLQGSMNLTLPEDGKFWTFYLDNKQDLDRIIYAAARKYQAVIPVNEMHTEVLIKLEGRKVLESFDPSKSRLNTFMTGRIRGYASHVFEEARRTLLWRDGVKATEEGFGDGRIVWTQVYMQDLNSPSSENEAPLFTLADDTETDTTALYNSYVRKIKSRLQKDLKIVFDCQLQDMSQREIAEQLKSAPAAIHIKCTKVRKIAEKVLKRKRPAKKAQTGANGHKKLRKRNLTSWEQMIIRDEFIRANGQIDSKGCLQIKAKLSPDVSIFQITGYIAAKLHPQVARGEIKLSDARAYNKYMLIRRRKWASYKSERYYRYAERLNSKK